MEGQGFSQTAVKDRKLLIFYNKFTFLNIFRWDMAGCNFLFQILGGSMQEQSKKMCSIWNKVCVCHKNKI